MPLILKARDVVVPSVNRIEEYQLTVSGGGDREQLLSIGVQTIILLATIFGSTELGLGTVNLIVTVLVIQIVAIFGAWLFSNISKKYGN